MTLKNSKGQARCSTILHLLCVAQLCIGSKALKTTLPRHTSSLGSTYPKLPFSILLNTDEEGHEEEPGPPQKTSVLQSLRWCCKLIFQYLFSVLLSLKAAPRCRDTLRMLHIMSSANNPTRPVLGAGEASTLLQRRTSRQCKSKAAHPLSSLPAPCAPLQGPSSLEGKYCTGSWIFKVEITAMTVLKSESSIFPPFLRRQPNWGLDRSKGEISS